MATIFSLSPKSNINGQHEVLIRYKSGKYAARAKSGVFTSPDWYEFVTGNNSDDPYKGKRLITPEMEEIKTYHSDQKAKFAEIISKIDEELKTADKNNSEWLVTVIDKYHNPVKYNPKAAEPEIKTLFQYLEHFIKEISNRKDKGTGISIAKNTIKQYNVFEKHLKNFAISIRKNDFEFSDINQSFYNKFVLFLQKKEFAQNTIGKTIKILKTILNEATIQGYNTQAYYNSFHVFKEEIDTIYLNEKELQQLKDTDFSKIQHLDRVCDWFLLLAWTGCRFSDLGKIAKNDIKDGFITFRQQKTNAKVVIPLHPVVLEILGKYEYNLPAEISNQRFNEYIKEACRIAEINATETMTRTVGGKLVTEKFEKWKLISSHTGRRSFCTNMYKRGLPTLMIMSISGHKTEKSFLKYIKVKQNEHAEMMKKAWENMYK
jgi:integrase